MNVNEMIEDINKRSNDIDIIETIKTSFENFYKDKIDYKFIMEYEYGPGLNLVSIIRNKHKGYKLDSVDDLFIEEIYNQLPTGIVVFMATATIKNNKCYIHSSKDYEYSLDELNISDEFIDCDYDNEIYGVEIQKKNNNTEIRLVGDCISCLRPLFYTLDILTESDNGSAYDYHNPIVKLIIKAIYESLVFMD